MEDKNFVVKDVSKLRNNGCSPAHTYIYAHDPFSWRTEYSYDNRENLISPTNGDLTKLINLRESIIKKLADYKKRVSSSTAIAITKQDLTVANNNKETLSTATIEIDKEIQKFEALAIKYWKNDKSQYAKSAAQRYAHNDNQSQFDQAKSTFETDTTSSRRALAGLKIREGQGYTTAWDPRQSSSAHSSEYRDSRGYNYWYSLFRDHAYSIVGLAYALPLLIGGAIVHGIDALITHVYALAVDTPAENKFKKEINKIEESIKSDEETVVQQTLFEITREFQTEEYKNFSTQCKSLYGVGFFAPKSETLIQACEQTSVASNDTQNTEQTHTLYPKN